MGNTAIHGPILPPNFYKVGVHKMKEYHHIELWMRMAYAIYERRVWILYIGIHSRLITYHITRRACCYLIREQRDNIYNQNDSIMTTITHFD